MKKILIMLALTAAVACAVAFFFSYDTRGSLASPVDHIDTATPPNTSSNSPALEPLQEAQGARGAIIKGPLTDSSADAGGAGLPTALESLVADFPDDKTVEKLELLVNSAHPDRVPDDQTGEIDGTSSQWYGMRTDGGEREGTWLRWSEGRLVESHSYSNGILSGPITKLYPSGTLHAYHSKVNFSGAQGSSFLWYANGERKAALTLRNSVQDGPCIYWKENGTIDRSISGTYSSGKLIEH